MCGAFSLSSLTRFMCKVCILETLSKHQKTENSTFPEITRLFIKTYEFVGSWFPWKVYTKSTGT